VKIPDGTAAVSADNQSSSTKVGHWEPGKAELDWQKYCLPKRKSEDLQKEFCLPPCGGWGQALMSRKTAVTIRLIVAAVIYFRKNSIQELSVTNDYS
jgi:hypothetical protein